MSSLNCIVCDCELEDAIPGTPDHPVENQPYKGTTFISHGQYGSTVWDPLVNDEEFLEINVCDACLTEAANTQKVLMGRVSRRLTTRYTPWHVD